MDVVAAPAALPMAAPYPALSSREARLEERRKRRTQQLAGLPSPPASPPPVNMDTEWATSSLNVVCGTLAFVHERSVGFCTAVAAACQIGVLGDLLHPFAQLSNVDSSSCVPLPPPASSPLPSTSSTEPMDSLADFQQVAFESHTPNGDSDQEAEWFDGGVENFHSFDPSNDLCPDRVPRCRCLEGWLIDRCNRDRLDDQRAATVIQRAFSAARRRRVTGHVSEYNAGPSSGAPSSPPPSPAAASSQL